MQSCAHCFKSYPKCDGIRYLLYFVIFISTKNVRENSYCHQARLEKLEIFFKFGKLLEVGTTVQKLRYVLHTHSDVALAQNTQNDYHHNNHRHCAFLVLHWQFYSRAFPPLASMKRKLAQITIERSQNWTEFYSKAKGENELQEGENRFMYYFSNTKTVEKEQHCCSKDHCLFEMNIT